MLHNSCIGFLGSSATDQEPEPSILFGISGHSLNRQEYGANSSTVPNGITYTQQASLLQGISAKIYRMDVATNAAGQSTNHAKFLDIISKCAAVGCKVLPMVYDRIDYGLTPAENYTRGFNQMQGFATLYQNVLDYVEFGNEIELFDDLKDSPGITADEYVPGSIDNVAQYVKGCYDGIRSVSSTMLTLTPGAAGWFPLALYDAIFEACPNIDRLSWHIYHEMPGGYLSNYGITDILTYLYDRWGKKIWITETNRRGDGSESKAWNEQKQYEWHQNFFPKCMANPHTEAYVIHELLDLPLKAATSYEEATFGIYDFPGIDLEAPQPPGPDYQGTLTPKALATYLTNQL